MLMLPAVSQGVPGRVVDREPTSCESAFGSRYSTVMLYSDIVVTDFTETGGMLGDWFLLGALTTTATPAKTARVRSRSAAAPARVRLCAGAIINVGPAVSALTGGAKLGIAEFISGPPPSTV